MVLICYYQKLVGLGLKEIWFLAVFNALRFGMMRAIADIDDY
jgi:hypothetical protein